MWTPHNAEKETVLVRLITATVRMVLRRVYWNDERHSNHARTSYHSSGKREMVFAAMAFHHRRQPFGFIMAFLHEKSTCCIHSRWMGVRSWRRGGAVLPVARRCWHVFSGKNSYSTVIFATAFHPNDIRGGGERTFSPPPTPYPPKEDVHRKTSRTVPS